MSTIEASRVSKRYGRVQALTDVSFEVPSGAIAAFVGPNAAGKSTLMRISVGFERPDAGAVEVDGHDVARDRSAALASVMYVPQESFLYRSLTVSDHFAVVAKLRPSFDRRSAESQLSAAGVPVSARPTQLSGGQRAQVMLALAMASHPRVYLLDEPVSSLDPLARGEALRSLADAIRKDGSTALMSSHVIDDIAMICDHLVVIGSGRVLLSMSVQQATSLHYTIGDFHRDSGQGSQSIGNIGGGRRLIRALSTESPSANAEAATMAEVVLGYLARGRDSAGGAPQP